MTSTPHVEMETVSDERLAEILAGLEGVTPGPWDTAVGLIRSIDGAEAIPIFETRAPWKKHRRIATVAKQEWHNGQHVARLDPETVRSMISELLALRAKQAPDGWQGIESAPKDGTEIILTDGESAGADKWVFWAMGGESWGHFRYLTPTHWQPLPASPLSEGTK